MNKPRIPIPRSQRRLSLREAGQMLVLAALVLPVLLGFSGLAIDVGMLLKHRTERQRTADAAALAGAQYLAYNPTAPLADAKQIACDYAQKNGYGNGSCNNSEVEVYIPPISGPAAGDDSFVEVIVKRTDNTFFLSVVGVQDATVKARAVGGAVPRKRNYALIVLNPTQCNAYNHTSSANITINGGGVIVNSDGSTSGQSCSDGSGVSARQGGGSVVSAQNCKDKDGVDIPCTLDYHRDGSWQLSSNAQAIPPPTKSPPFPDPLTCGPPPGNQAEEYCPRPVACTDLAGTTPSNCVPRSICSAGSATNINMTSINNVADPALCRAGDKLILYPGTYYGGITLQEGSVKTVEFKAGLYVLAGGASGSKGGFNCCPTAVSSITTVSHNGLTGVTIFNTDYPAAQNQNDRLCGQMKLTGASSVNLSAPTVPHTTILSGYKNMLFWQSETCSNYGSEPPSFDFAGGTSGGTWTTTGIIYLPLGRLNVSGGGDFGSVQIIVNRFTFSGSTPINIQFTRFIDTDTIQYKLVE
jgi:Flp pilus assembly protein TadG